MNIPATRFATHIRTWLLIGCCPVPVRHSGRRDEPGRILVLRQARAQGQPRAAARAGAGALAAADRRGPRAPGRGAGAAGVCDPLRAAKCVRGRPQPAALGGRGHRGAARAAPHRPSQGRARTRVRAHQEPRHPDLVDRGDTPCSSASPASASTSPKRPALSCSGAPRRWPTRSPPSSADRRTSQMNVNPATASLYAVNPLAASGDRGPVHDPTPDRGAHPALARA